MQRRFTSGISAGEAADWLAPLQADDCSPKDETALGARPIAGPGRVIAFEAMRAIWENVGALSREFPTGEIRRSPELRGVRIIEIN